MVGRTGDAPRVPRGGYAPAITKTKLTLILTLTLIPTLTLLTLLTLLSPTKPY